MALACDFVLASDRSRFSEIFARRGLNIDFGGSFILPRIVGMQKAKELVLLADILDAERAQEMGLVNRVVPQSELDTIVEEFVSKLGEGGFGKVLLVRHAAEEVDANDRVQLVVRDGARRGGARRGP